MKKGRFFFSIKERPGTYGLIALGATFLIFWVRELVFLDPDFGYRLRTGSIILSQGFPRSDPYSYTMPSFPYVEHAWLIGVFWSILYSVFGVIGLSAISAALAVLALIIAVSRGRVFLKKHAFFRQPEGYNLWYFGSFVFLLAIAVLLPFSGNRAQVFSWVLVSILLMVVFSPERMRRWRFIFPAYFLLWANTHGSFAAGIAIFAFVILARALRTKRFKAKDGLVFTLSLLATLITPYGSGTWREALSSVADTSLRWRIAEWMPAVFMVDLSFIALLTLSFFFIYRYKNKFKPEEIGLYLVVLLQALLSRRHIPLWAIIALPMTVTAISYFYQEVRGIRGAVTRFKKVYFYTWVGSLLLLALQSFFSLRSAHLFSEDKFYPKGAVSFLREDLPEGRIFSEYAWGGYLIWKLPEKKVFIDGRMPSWKWKGNPAEESEAAFDEYEALLQGEVNYVSVFNKFGVDTVVWPQERPLGGIDILAKYIENFLIKPDKEKEEFDFIQTLEKDGWEKIFEDDIAVIYQKLNSNQKTFQ